LSFPSHVPGTRPNGYKKKLTATGILTYFMSENAGSEIFGFDNNSAAFELSPKLVFHFSNASGRLDGAYVLLKKAASGDL
jgi:hypothetical protein